MEKEFIPYELAVALKELGFDEPCLTCYDKLGMIASHSKNVFDYKNYNTSGYIASRPTFSQVFRWFRDKYGLIGWVEGKIMFMYRMESPIESDDQLNCSPFRTYEEAELECLKELIKIVKEK